MTRLIACAAMLASLSALAADKEEMFHVKGKKRPIAAYRVPGDSAFFYRTDDFSTDYDGAPTAYHPQGKSKGKALDYNANAGKPGNWYGIVTHNGKKNGDPVVQKASDPAPGYHVSSTSLADKTKHAHDPRRYVDASTVPYIVLPPKAQKQKNPGGASLGDFAAVVNMKTGKVAYAIFADSGPGEKMGEGSLVLRKELGKEKGGWDLVWVVFPGSKKTPAWPVGNEVISREGKKLFDRFGGVAKVRALFGKE